MSEQLIKKYEQALEHVSKLVEEGDIELNPVRIYLFAKLDRLKVDSSKQREGTFLLFPSKR